MRPTNRIVPALLWLALGGWTGETTHADEPGPGWVDLSDLSAWKGQAKGVGADQHGEA